MALIKAKLAADIEAAFNAAYADKGNSNAAQKTLANAIANAIDTYIKAGQVVGQSPAGPVTGKLT